MSWVDIRIHDIESSMNVQLVHRVIHMHQHKFSFSFKCVVERIKGNNMRITKNWSCYKFNFEPKIIIKILIQVSLCSYQFLVVDMKSSPEKFSSSCTSGTFRCYPSQESICSNKSMASRHVTNKTMMEPEIPVKLNLCHSNLDSFYYTHIYNQKYLKSIIFIKYCYQKLFQGIFNFLPLIIISTSMIKF